MVDLRSEQFINFNSLRLGNPSSKSSGRTSNDSQPLILRLCNFGGKNNNCDALETLSVSKNISSSKFWMDGVFSFTWVVPASVALVRGRTVAFVVTGMLALTKEDCGFVSCLILGISAST